jgi:hypothetical protein
MRITQERLKQLVKYDPETGVFTRADNGKKAGSLRTDGYVSLCVDGVVHRAHQLAFVYMTGRCPKSIDHRNGVNGDNRWGNLREATQSQNSCNRGLRSDNTSGAKGVRWLKSSGKWIADITLKGKRRHLGLFESFELAVEFRQLAADMLHGEFARHA